MKQCSVIAGTMLTMFFLALTCADARDGNGSAAARGSHGGVAFERTLRLTDIDKKSGEEVCFTLTAKDQNGNVIRSWNTSGTPTTITLKGSDANTDSSTRSWNADPDGYSWARLTHEGTPLTQLSPNEWSISNTAFDANGQARICLIHSKTSKGVTLMITPFYAGLNQETEKMNFIEGDQTNYLVELTSHVPGKPAVYHMRQYEITVTPRDRYLNVTHMEVATRFSARWPGEFDNTVPGLADIFAGEVFIKGPTPYLVASRIIRTLPGDILQHIIAYASSDPTINGRSDDYEILSHEPADFVLIQPRDGASIILWTASQTEDFTWSKPSPADPYFQIKTSNTRNDVFSDTVSYTLVLLDSVSLTRSLRFPSNGLGADAKLTLSYAQLGNVILFMSGSKMSRAYTVVWYVEATDGLYIKRNTPPANDPTKRPGNYLFIRYDSYDGATPVAAPERLGLQQNFPNPFNPSTTIQYSIPASGRVQLRIYDLLGAPVRTLIDDNRAAGVYNADFDAAGLPSGTYIYKLSFNGETLTRRMTLMK